jgi:hypothetical protein
MSMCDVIRDAQTDELLETLRMEVLRLRQEKRTKDNTIRLLENRVVELQQELALARQVGA